METEYKMSNKEKLYHQANVAAVPAMFLSGFLMIRMGYMLDANQISMGDSITSTSSSLLWIIFGASILWLLISGVINKNIKSIVRRSLNGVLKSFIAKVVLFIILVVAILVNSLLLISFLVLAGYLFVTSVRTLTISTSISL